MWKASEPRHAPRRRESQPDNDPPTPQAVRLLLHRKVLAAYRHRAAVAHRLGMTESEVTALAYLGQGGMTPGQLAERLQLTSGGITALLHRLERNEDIRRQPHPRDRRSVILHASPKLLEQIADLYQALADDTDQLIEHLPARERKIIAHALQQIADLSEHHADTLLTPDEEHDITPPSNQLLQAWAQQPAPHRPPPTTWSWPDHRHKA